MIKEFLSKAIVSGNKSTVLLPLRWLIGLSFSGTLIAAGISAPQWILIMFSIVSGLATLLFLYAYIYSLIKQPENLRSEEYTIQKMAIERGFFGDDIVGQIKIETEEDVKLIEEETLKSDSSEQ